MGFYGNIGNTTTSSFTFDKTYPNRKTMDISALDDGVFIGRYVLIEYDTNDTSFYTQLYKNENDDFYFDQQFKNKVQVTEITNDEIVYVMENNIAIIYQVKIENSNLSFIKIEESNDPYLTNYLIDKKSYSSMDTGFGRGYDSTVWQKVFTNNVEKYIQIAELNSVVPTFDITVDAPTINPAKPHFDWDSNDVYYKLHLQPNWGFRVKKAAEENGLSDFETSYTNSLNAPINAGGSFDDTSLTYNGEIYINKAGFDSTQSNHDNDNSDHIAITPTGYSEAQYSSHDSSNTSAKNRAPDIQELSIKLPSIGNTVATLWDIAYGTERNQDINWDSTQGLRLVKEDDSGTGFTYNPGDVETIAGCINSVHDLMGMIVKHDNNITAESADANKVYFKNGEYLFKEKTYEYTLANGKEPYREITLGDVYSADKYYTKNANDDYFISNDIEALEGVHYHNITPTVANIGPKWQSGRYYYQNGTTYELDNNEMPISGINYYDNQHNGVNNTFATNCVTVASNNEQVFITEMAHTEQTINENGSEKKYKFGLFAIANDNISYPISNTQSLPNGKTVQSYFIGQYTFEQELDENGNVVTTYTFKHKITIGQGKYLDYNSNVNYYNAVIENNQIKYVKIDALPATYYQEYVLNSGNQNNIPTYYIINLKDEIKETVFYTEGTYYIQKLVDNKGTDGVEDDVYNYLKATGEYVSTETYYIVTSEMFEKFYEPNVYYYKNENDEYILDASRTKQENRTYYEHSDLYVDGNYDGSDFIPGAKWNEEISSSNYPDVAAYRWEKWELKELPGFARTLNTIHGLILRINNLIKFDDKLTRDLSTVQGCINKLNDIIHTIGALKPNHFIAVDEAGHMVSMAQETDNWIDIQINNDNNDKIIINHEFHGGIDTNSDSNVNGNGDTINLYTPILDKKGHVIAKNTETVTLPFGYKVFKDSEETVGQTVAANTQDTLVLKGDSWIKPTVSQGQIQYSHIGPVEKNNRTEANETPKFGETFEIEDWDFDDKGHKASLGKHTVTIPQGSLTAAASNDSDVIIQLDFVPSTGAITTTRKDISTIKLNSYSKSTDNSDIASTDTLGQALSKLQTQIINEETARSNAISNLDVSEIITSNSQVLATLSETDGKISATTKNAGDLILTGLTYGSGNNTASVNDTDSINGAFVKVQNQLNVLNGSQNTVGSVAYQIAQIVNGADQKYGTLKEIADWINSDTSGAASMNTKITANSEAIEDLELLINLEKVTQWNAAEQNVQSDWNETDNAKDSYIKNKPTNLITSNTTFTYGEQQMIISKLFEKVAELEQEIKNLKEYHTTTTE